MGSISVAVPGQSRVKSGEKTVKNYMAITIEQTPRISLIDEDNIGDKIINSRPIFHSWLRNKKVGIIGIRFSAWMINQTLLSKAEKDLINSWNTESDYELFFGEEKEFDSENSIDDVVKYTSIIKLEKGVHGVAFPLFGTSMSKAEIANLESTFQSKS